MVGRPGAALFTAAVAHVALAKNGYVLTSQSQNAMMGTRVPFLNVSDPEIMKLSAGLTYMAWLRFDDIDAELDMPNWYLQTDFDYEFLAPFGGANGGYSFAGISPPAVASLGEAARDWHHYTQVSLNVFPNRRLQQLHCDRQPAHR